MEENKEKYTRDEAVKAILTLEKKKKKIKFLNTIASSIATMAIAISFSLIVTYVSNRFFKDKNTIDPKSIQNKITELDNVQSSLKNLNDFLDEQKAIIIEQQLLIEKLQKKNTELEPIVNSNQQTVDAIMIEAENKAEKNVWKERIIGIVLGVISSLIASFLWRKFIKTK